jgi:hypothetical protein
LIEESIIHDGAKNSLYNKRCWENWIATCRRLKLDPCLSSSNKINSNWIEDPNISPETLKTTARSIWKYTGTKRYRECLPKQSSKVSSSKRMYKQMGLHQTKELLHSKGHPTEWEKIFAIQ